MPAHLVDYGLIVSVLVPEIGDEAIGVPDRNVVGGVAGLDGRLGAEGLEDEGEFLGGQDLVEIGELGLDVVG